MNIFFKQILFVLIALFSFACSRYAPQSSVQIVVSGLTSNLNKDLILNGLSQDGEYFSTHLKANQTPSPIEIPVGNGVFMDSTGKTKQPIVPGTLVNLSGRQKELI